MKPPKLSTRLTGAWLNMVVAGAVALLLWLILHAGKTVEMARGVPVAGSVTNTGNSNAGLLGEMISFHHPLSVLILQILVIIIASRLLGWLMSLINQPTVIGEILAGILLGPSLLGLYLPETSTFLFPVASLGNLQFLSQIGLILFMFIIGMELDAGILRQNARAAVFISNSSIVVPFVMGAGLAYFLFDRFAPEGAHFVAFALFMGIAMSITAFPVLARIVQERGISRSPLGITAITCAAVNDITAWGILAVVVAIANAGAIGGALLTIALSMLYIVLMLFLIKPLLHRVALKYTVKETISKTVVALVLSIMLISAYITEVIGIHALFGAFMAGVIIPDNARFKHIMAEKIEDVSLVLLLPLFFVYTGLRTQIGLLAEPSLWLTALVVISVAVAGKFAGSALATRITGQSWKDSLLIGALMSTRGLIELVALNIGYDIGVLSPEIFTILVLMALATTMMTGPAISLIQYLFGFSDKEKSSAGLMRVLIAFGPPEAGGRLTNLAIHLFGRRKNGFRLTALHLTPNTEISIKNAKIFEEKAFVKVSEVSSATGLDVKRVYRTAGNVSQEIIKMANRGRFDLLVVGSSRPLLSQDETGGKARYFFDNVHCDVGLFIDRGTAAFQRILLLAESEDEVYLQELAASFGPAVVFETHCLLSPSNTEFEIKKPIFKPFPEFSGSNTTTGYDLIITTLACYKHQREARSGWVDGDASILLISRRQSR